MVTDDAQIPSVVNSSLTEIVNVTSLITLKSETGIFKPLAVICNVAYLLSFIESLQNSEADVSTEMEIGEPGLHFACWLN